MRAHSHKEDCHKLHTLSVNGVVLQPTVEQAVQIMLSRGFLGTGLCFVILLSVFDTDLFHQPANFLTRSIYWFTHAIAAAAIWYSMLRLHGWVQIWLQRPIVIPTVCNHITMVAIILMIDEVIFTDILGHLEKGTLHFFGELTRHVILLTIFEIIVVAFAFPKDIPQFDSALRRMVLGVISRGTSEDDGNADEPAEPAQVKSPQTSVTIGDAKFLPYDIRYVRAAEHYVEVVTKNGPKTVRASMHQATEALRRIDGMRTHRSFWVSHSAIAGLERRKGGVWLVLFDDTQVPVSRSRKTEVLSWAARKSDRPEQKKTRA